MILSVLVGCKKDDTDIPTAPPDDSFKIPEGLSGTDVIKLLLASKRLDSQLLKTEGDIFETGEQVMQNLASKARANLSAVALAEVSEAPRGGKLEVDGDTFVWSDFKENCNSYDYFENITQSIINCAEQGAVLIDDTKKHVRVIDKWIAVGENQYYLGVDENSETIFSRINDSISMCKRYKNESGENVYEMYFYNDIVETRMLYVPGERYELSEKFSAGDGQYFIADSSKGYWETLSVGERPNHYNVSYFAMKKDICYDALYTPEHGEISVIKAMSSDRATDILFFRHGSGSAEMTLNLGGFNGIQSVEITASSDKIAESQDVSTDTTTVIYSTTDETYAATTGAESAILNLANGGKIEYGASYANGTVTAGRTTVNYGSGIYMGNLEITVSGETSEEIFANLDTFLTESGLVCRRDINSVLSGIDRAYSESYYFVNYHRWNGHKIQTNDDFGNAIAEELKLLAELRTLYEAVKDAQVIDISDEETLELNIDFSPVTLTVSGSASFANMTSDVSGLTLTVSDTTLFVENDSYVIDFALIKDGRGTADIVHITTDSPTETVYTGTETFTLGTAHATLEIPELADGKYTLVCYVATSDKIRASQYIPVAFTQIEKQAITLSSSVLVPEQGENGELLLTYLASRDVTVSIEKGVELDYASLRALLREQADIYGIASGETLEILDSESATFVPISDTEAPLVSGIYRLAYDVTDGETVFNGYIHAEYTAPHTR